MKMRLWIIVWEFLHNLSLRIKRIYLACDLSVDISCETYSSTWEFLCCNGPRDTIFVWWESARWGNLCLTTFIGSNECLFNNKPCEMCIVLAMANWIGIIPL